MRLVTALSLAFAAVMASGCFAGGPPRDDNVDPKRATVRFSLENSYGDNISVYLVDSRGNRVGNRFATVNVGHTDVLEMRPNELPPGGFKFLIDSPQERPFVVDQIIYDVPAGSHVRLEIREPLRLSTAWVIRSR